jgi:hypothetical protein
MMRDNGKREVMAVNLQEVRDLVLIVAGSIAVLLLLALLAFTVIVGVATRMVLGSLQTVLKGEVTPILDSARQTLQRVEGTATFIGETAVTPVIRVYSVVIGTRRVLTVLSGVAGRRKHRE